MASSTRTAYLLLLVGLLALAAVTAAYAHDHGDDDNGDDDDNESRISHWRNFFPTPRNCARDTERIQNDSVIQDFTAANVNCTSGKCNTALEDMKDRCRELRGGVCSTKATFTKSDTDGAPRESMTSYRCVPRTCRMDENEHEFRIATRMYERGYSNVHVHFKCHGASGGGDVAWHALKFVALLGFLIFACFEKKRRYRNGMAQAWPANGTRGTMRTKLCGCCGCSAGCWRALFCALPLSTFNRAELDGRAWRWADFLCMHPGVAYFNRQTIRRKLDAKPQPCRDFIKTVLCYPWVVAQNTREIEHGFVGNVDAPLAQPIGQAFATNIAPGSVVQLTETKV